MADADVIEEWDLGYGDATTPDRGTTDAGTDDASGVDAAGPDGGSDDTGVNRDAGQGGCANASYCITALAPDIDHAMARELVSFTPTIDNPNQLPLTFTARVSNTRRRANLPAAVLSELTVQVLTDAQGTATFALNDVPPWFATTTFEIELTADGPEGAVSITAETTVQGNVLVSSSNRVLGVASDGEPATSINFSNGELISGTNFIRDPADLLLARDGTLVVVDEGTNPLRLRRFELVGENASLPDFADVDANGADLVTGDPNGLTQLDDGRFVLVEYDFSRSVESRIIIWNEDGSHSASYDDPINVLELRAPVQVATGELLVAHRSTVGRIIRINLSNGRFIDDYLTDVANAFSMRALADGSVMVGAVDSFFRVTPQGGRRMVSMLPQAPTGASWDFDHIADFGDGVIVAIDENESANNLFIVENDQFVRPLRSMPTGQSFFPAGITTLQ